MKLGSFRVIGQQWFALLLLFTSAFPQAKTSSSKDPLKAVADIPLRGQQSGSTTRASICPRAPSTSRT